MNTSSATSVSVEAADAQTHARPTAETQTHVLSAVELDAWKAKAAAILKVKTICLGACACSNLSLG